MHTTHDHHHRKAGTGLTTRSNKRVVNQCDKTLSLDKQVALAKYYYNSEHSKKQWQNLIIEVARRPILTSEPSRYLDTVINAVTN